VTKFCLSAFSEREEFTANHLGERDSGTAGQWDRDSGTEGQWAYLLNRLPDSSYSSVRIGELKTVYEETRRLLSADCMQHDKLFGAQCTLQRCVFRRSSVLRIALCSDVRYRARTVVPTVFRVFSVYQQCAGVSL
jgi:hypothetical protein